MVAVRITQGKRTALSPVSEKEWQTQFEWETDPTPTVPAKISDASSQVVLKPDVGHGLFT